MPKMDESWVENTAALIFFENFVNTECEVKYTGSDKRLLKANRFLKFVE